MKDIKQLLKEHNFFKPFPAAQVDYIAGCGRNVHFKSGQYLARDGDDADQFYIIRRGHAIIELNTPPRGVMFIQSLHSGDIAGWSWIYPPYKWTFDVKATGDVSAIALDGKCLREKCEQDPALGYSLMKSFAKIMTDRLKATRLQLMDVYGQPSTTSELRDV